MRLLFIINTPAQAYTWQNIIKQLFKKNYTIKILARDYGSSPTILKSFGFQYDTFKPIGSRFWRFLGSFDHLQKCYGLSKEYSPSMVIGFGVDAAITSMLFRKPCVIFMDDELTHFQNRIAYRFASLIVTPDTFRYKLGKKHLLVNSYKELAYLHPTFFTPDPTIYDELKIKKGDRYVILRFNVFDAIHDIGKHGFNSSDQFKLVKELGEYARVFISPEGILPKELEAYRLPIAMNRIHHALFYAQLLVTDTQTMTIEAAVLGTPAVRSNDFVGPNDFGTFIELERKYDLIYSFYNSEQAIQKAIALIRQPNLKEQWAEKRGKLMADKINLTPVMVDYIENYSVSSPKRNDTRGSL